MDDKRYVANITNRMVNQKVAILYAKDPKAIARRRKRLDFQFWDGKLESLQAAAQTMQMVVQSGGTGTENPQVAEANAILQDYQHGCQLREMVDRVGKTLETLYQYEVDTQEPNFKIQMKQVVRRVVITGVAYVGVHFEREFENCPNSSATRAPMMERVQRARQITEKLDNGEIDEQSAEAEELRVLLMSLIGNIETPGPEQKEVTERLVFDFIPSTNIIVDPRCKSLKGFVGAHWIAQEFILPVDYINAEFETDIKPGGELTQYHADGEQATITTNGTGDAKAPVLACMWCIYDRDTKSHFYIVDGHKDYVQKPEAVEPETHSFWPIKALTFNDCEVEPGQKASIYPPSDVDMMKHAQKEWNRAREALRKQRHANGPKYVTGKGWLTDDDKTAFANAQDSEVIELEGANRGEDLLKLLVPFQHAPIDPALYSTKEASDDMMLAGGAQEANLGPAKPNVTATVGNIAEQSRMTMSSSNVDDLDDFLSELARYGGEMLLRECSETTVKRVVGPGAVWPSANRQDFLNAIYLEVVAASSGRPNKAMEIQNMQQLGPLLMQAGANPMFLVREMIRRLDDRIDPEEAFPLVPPSSLLSSAGKQAAGPPPQGGPSGPQQQGGPPMPSGPKSAPAPQQHLPV